MRADVLRVVQAYIDAVQANDTEALPLHPQVVFDSPLKSIRGAEEFRAALVPFVRMLRGIEIEHLIADDATCAAVLTLETVFGRVPFVEFFEVRDGLIVSIRAYYDPRPMLAGAPT